MCIVTRKILTKDELFRVVKTNNNDVTIDISYSIKGRGAYICKNQDIILQAKKRNLFSKALRTNVNEDIYQQLIDLL